MKKDKTAWRANKGGGERIINVGELAGNLAVCFVIKVTRENQVFYPPLLKGGQGGFL
jgi:hypothetical protein